MSSARNSLLAAAAIGLALLASRPAGAAVDCSASVSGVAFGLYDPFAAAPDDSTGTVTVTCVYLPPGTATRVNYTVSLSAGAGGTPAQRLMAAGSSPLGYNLFADSARSQVWADGSAGTVTISGSFQVGPGVGNGTRTTTHTIYGRITALQPAAPGTYTDSIILTLTF